MSQGDENKQACCVPAAGGVVPLGISVGRPGGSAPLERVAGGDTADMVRLDGGEFLMGNETHPAFAPDGEGPVRKVAVRPFLIDRHAVTNELFARFVKATGHKTDAEKFGWSYVFAGHVAKARLPSLRKLPEAPWWVGVPGAKWDRPLGDRSDLKGRMDHPVVHVSWADAVAYCRWAKKRLPTEAEWEYASRGGLVQKIYPWGDELTPQGKHRCNIWQGKFPETDTGEDGYRGTCPVHAFPPNAYGLFNMTGNAWEWCLDWFSMDFHVTGPRDNPTGPAGGTHKIIKGGSHLCHRSYCNRYRCGARTSSTPDSSLSHAGFRCVMDV